MDWEYELVMYAEMGNLAKVKECLANYVNVNLNKYDKYALCNASENGHFEIVKYLVENGVNVNTSNGIEALMWASENGHFEVVKYFSRKRNVSSSAIFGEKLYLCERNRI